MQRLSKHKLFGIIFAFACVYLSWSMEGMDFGYLCHAIRAQTFVMVIVTPWVLLFATYGKPIASYMRHAFACLFLETEYVEEYVMISKTGAIYTALIGIADTILGLIVVLSSDATSGEDIFRPCLAAVLCSLFYGVLGALGFLYVGYSSRRKA